MSERENLQKRCMQLSTRQSRYRESKDQIYRSGFIAGFSTVLAMLFLLGIYLTQFAILTVYIDLEDLTSSTANLVTLEAKEALPELIDHINTEIPRQVAEELSVRLGRASLTIYDMTVVLPPESLTDLNSQIETLLVEEMQRSLSEIDTDTLSEEWGIRAKLLMEEEIISQYNGMIVTTYFKEEWPWLKVSTRILFER